MEATLNADVRNLSVLIVDDNKDAANSLAFVVGHDGCDATTAYDGEDAVSLLEAFHYDVVLCDIGLPGRSGYEVARHVRETPGPRPLMVAISAYSGPDVIRHARRAGFDCFFSKPADPAALEELLHQYAARRDDPRRTDFVFVQPLSGSPAE